MHGWVLIMQAVFLNAPLQFSSCAICSTIYRCSFRNDAVFHKARLSSRHDAVFHNAPLKFSSGMLCSTMHNRVLVMTLCQQCIVPILVMMLCSTMLGWGLVPQCTVAVFVMTLCSTMHGCSSCYARCVPQCTVEFSSCTLCSTMHRYSSRHDDVFYKARLSWVMTLCSIMLRCSSRQARYVPQCTVELSSWLCVPHCTVVVLVMMLCSTMHGWVLVMHHGFHNALLHFSSCTLCYTMHGSVLVMHAVFHHARAVLLMTLCSKMHICSSRDARCVPQWSVEFSIHNAPLKFSS